MMAPARIHLDNNATRPVSDAAFEAMLPFLREQGGNPSSIHASGATVRAALESARERIAEAIGGRPYEIAFTSGATESINWALRGTLDAAGGPGRIVTSLVEHSVTLDVVERLRRRGHEVELLPVDAQGILDPQRVAEALERPTTLLSLIWANNETGVLFDVAAIGVIARERGVPFHVDAVQVLDKIPRIASTAPIDLLSWSSHKFAGPKGSGGLWVRRGARLRPLMWGGHQESARRAGTENVPGIVGSAAALVDAQARWQERSAEIRRLRDRLEDALRAGVDDLIVNAADAPRVENTLSVCFRGIEGSAVVLTLSQRGVDCSSGSACTASDPGPSHVLRAMGVDGDWIHGAVRFSLSSDTTEDEIERAARLAIAAWRHVARVG